MQSGIWAEAHGAIVHFPIAFSLCSLAFDGAALALRSRPVSRELHAVGYWTLLTGALGSIGAVISGLFMTRGGLLGHGALRLHHLFVWPSFSLIIGLATWRLITGQRMTQRAFLGYLGAMAFTAALISIAGYWGGALMTAI